MPLHLTEPARHLAMITIDNPAKRNALSRDDLQTLATTWDRLADDTTCRCILITGTGDRAFCAGADIGGDLSASAETAQRINDALLKTKVYTKPIIAAVNGDCAGGGVELLLSTDIRVAATTARFGLPEVKWSIYPFGGATVKLVQQIGYVHAMDLILTGRLIDAATAADLNLVNRVVAPDTVLDDAIATASMIAANSPVAVQAVKEQISAGIAAFTQSREAAEQQLGDRVRASPHFTTGVAAFRNKTTPTYD